jgi:hypothetical protein
MPVLVAIASLPFGLREGTYSVRTPPQMATIHVSQQRYSPAITISSRPELAEQIPAEGAGEGWTTYTWYDHPFVLRATFGRNVAALGSLNSWATLSLPLDDDFDIDDEGSLAPVRDRFAEEALLALNYLIAVVRRKARLYHVFDLQREDIDISLRRPDGTIVHEDPLQETLSNAEEHETERFDLLYQPSEWYDALISDLQRKEGISLVEELLMEAERALWQRFPRQAITTSHTTIETAVSTLLTRAMSRRGMTDEETDQALSTRSPVYKLDALLRTYTGFSLKRDNLPLWRSFNLLTTLRNDVVHRGKSPTVADAQFAITCARQIVAWLGVVAHRNQSLRR